MIGAFVNLTLWSVKNRLRARVRRLREPRYLVGLTIGVVWFGWAVVAPLFRAPRSGAQVESPVDLFLKHLDAARFVVALVLFALALLIALLPGQRTPLQFSPAEVQFLFPAPISRRQLVNYKLLRSQGGLLFGAAVATLILRPGTLRDGWMFSVGFWLLLTAGRLYAIGVGLGRQAPIRRRVGGFRSDWIVVALAIGAVVVVGLAALADWRQLAATTTAGERLEEIRRIWSSGAPRIVLWPFVTLAKLPFAGSAAAFWSAFPGVLLLLVACYAYVIRTDAAFEEGAAAEAEAPAAERAKAPRVAVRGRGAPFRLALAGRPETAILWKNLILLGRYASVSTLLKVLLVAIPFPVIAVASGKSSAGTVTVLTLSLMTAVMALVIGPGVVRNDLRQDLARLAVLKTWPVSGTAIVRGELLAPAIVLCVVAWLSILIGALALGSLPGQGRMKVAALLSHLVSYAGVAMLVAPAIILIQLVVQNGLAVLFPAWMTPGRTRDRGIEGTGQQMLMVWGGLFAAAALLVPPAVAAGLVMVMLAAITHVRALVVLVPAAVLLLLVLVESLLLTKWLGRVFDRSDLSAVDPQP